MRPLKYLPTIRPSSRIFAILRVLVASRYHPAAMPQADKPLGIKAYGHVCHLPGSRLGPGDHKLTPGQARILTEKARDKHDRIIVREKLDGSNVAVARVNGELILSSAPAIALSPRLTNSTSAFTCG